MEIRDLLKTLYDTACMKKQWSIVRHCAGMDKFLERKFDINTPLTSSSHLLIQTEKIFVGYLGRRVDDLSKAVTDMLVRQKQVR